MCNIKCNKYLYECTIQYISISVYSKNLPPHIFPGSSAGKESAYNASDPGLTPRLGKFPVIFLLWISPHSSTLAWKISWMVQPGRLQSMGLLRVRHDWVTSLSLFTFMHWRRKLQPTPVFLPGESQGRGSLVGCCLWGRTESDTTEVT